MTVVPWPLRRAGCTARPEGTKVPDGVFTDQSGGSRTAPWVRRSGPSLSSRLDGGLLRGAGLADDLDVTGGVQQVDEAPADDLVVVEQESPDR